MVLVVATGPRRHVGPAVVVAPVRPAPVAVVASPPLRHAPVVVVPPPVHRGPTVVVAGPRAMARSSWCAAEHEQSESIPLVIVMVQAVTAHITGPRTARRAKIEANLFPLGGRCCCS